MRSPFMQIIPETQIVNPEPQWSPYPHGTNAVACTETMQSIPRDVSLFPAPEHTITREKLAAYRQAENVFFERELKNLEGIRFGETVPVMLHDEVIGFVGPCAEGNRALATLAISREESAMLEAGTKPVSMGYSAREHLESDGVPEPLGSDDEPTKPAAPRNSTPIECDFTEGLVRSEGVRW